jgi:riboflavin kinase/FMN adenylyltransferase
VVKVDAFIMSKNIVSSTLIRNLLKEGKIVKANQFLDYKFCLFGKVVKGNQLGRKIGFKTANIILDYPNKIVPKIGVYVVESTIDNQIRYGMMNIGYRPTIQGKTRTIEIHFFDVEKNLYNQNLKVKVHCRLRDELKFENLDALKTQLAYDKKEAIKYLQK